MICLLSQTLAIIQPAIPISLPLTQKGSSEDYLVQLSFHKYSLKACRYCESFSATP